MSEKTPEEATRKTFLDLSLTQIVGSSLAAATAAFLGSRLGVVGTIIGAMLASVVSAIAAAAYTTSLRRTQELVRRRALSAGSGETRILLPEAKVESFKERLRGLPWKRIGLAAGAVFVITAIAITSLELITGKSIDGSGRTTVTRTWEPAETTHTPSPTPTPTNSPSPTSTLLPERTPNIPSPTIKPTPTQEPTQNPSDQPTEQPTPTDTGTGPAVVTPEATDGSTQQGS